MLHVLRVAAFLVLCGELAATWSIILIDTRTGEIAVGSATCIPGYDLRRLTAVIVVGKGGACAQSYVDGTGNNRVLIFEGLRKDLSPADILAALAKSDTGHETRQYGIVDTAGRAIGFSGASANEWKGHVTGRIGTIAYAIQGNILTGKPVVDAAEKAVKETKGDLASKLMAGMEAARAMGGDGRCSCTTGGPTSCGSPPQSFTKSADIGFMILARQGDTDGVCNGAWGCANGTYYMNLNVTGSRTDPDPVLTLKTMYDAWRKALAGRPDHHLSEVTAPTDSLPADGATKTTLRVVLRDVDGKPLAKGGAKVTAAVDPDSTATVQAGAAVDHQDGSYSIPLQAGASKGDAHVRITVDDGKGAVQLAPRTTLRITADKLWVAPKELPKEKGGDLEFVINQGAANAGRIYMLLASGSGTTPGIVLGPNLTVPVNIDAVFWIVLWGAGTTFPGFLGTLDSTGRQTVRLPMPRGLYDLPVPGALSFATSVFHPLEAVSNPVTVALVQ